MKSEVEPQFVANQLEVLVATYYLWLVSEVEESLMGLYPRVSNYNYKQVVLELNQIIAPSIGVC